MSRNSRALSVSEVQGASRRVARHDVAHLKVKCPCMRGTSHFVVLPERKIDNIIILHSSYTVEEVVVLYRKIEKFLCYQLIMFSCTLVFLLLKIIL